MTFEQRLYEKEVIEAWIVKNVTAEDVPNDEGSTEALIYNLTMKLHYGEDYEPYDYLRIQNEHLLVLFQKHGLDTTYLEELVKTHDKYLNREEGEEQ